MCRYPILATPARATYRRQAAAGPSPRVILIPFAVIPSPSPLVILSGALYRLVRGGAKNLLFRASRFDCAPFDFAQGG